MLSEIYSKAADELWLVIETTAQKLRFDEERYQGVLFRRLIQIRRKKFSARCVKKAENRQVTLMKPRFAPDLGAILLAMKLSGFLSDFFVILFL